MRSARSIHIGVEIQPQHADGCEFGTPGSRITDLAEARHDPSDPAQRPLDPADDPSDVAQGPSDVAQGPSDVAHGPSDPAPHPSGGVR